MRLIFDRRSLPTHFTKSARIIFYASILVSALQGIALGAALELYEIGDIGTASAGQAALAEDASTAAKNPAGMTLLDRSQLMSSPGVLLPSTNFDVAPETHVSPLFGGTKGGGGGNAGVFFPIGSFFYVRKLSERLRFGVAVYSDYGGGVDYGKTWVGRYNLTELSLITGKVNPSLAYDVNDWFSVGAGFSFAVGRLTLQSRINNAAPRVPDGGFSARVVGRSVRGQGRHIA